MDGGGGGAGETIDSKPGDDSTHEKKEKLKSTDTWTRGMGRRKKLCPQNVRESYSSLTYLGPSSSPLRAS